MRRREKREKNPLVDQVLVGPLEAARLWSYRYAGTFKRHLPNLRRVGQIRSIQKLNGTFYVLEDLMKIRHPGASHEEVKAMVKEYQEQKIEARARGNQRNEWIKPKEASMILGLPSEGALEAHVRKFPRIRKVKRQGHVCYNLRDCFRRVFQEADDQQLDQVIMDYKREQLEKRSKYNENS